MLDLVRLEFQKLKRTSMKSITIALAILPIVLIFVQYLVSTDEDKTFYTVTAANNVVITMCLYTVAIIIACYMITREYQDRTIIYLFITPQSRAKLLIAKYIVLFIQLTGLGACTYGFVLILNAIYGCFSADVLRRLVCAWLVGVVLFFLLMPFIFSVALWRKNFVSAMLIALVLLIFTTPFMFTNNFYAFPHLIPMAVSNNFLRIENRMDINYPAAFGILAIVFVVFTFVSFKLFERKE